MKKLTIVFLNFCLIAWLMNQAISYDQEFPSIKLRHGHSYNFGDEVNNNNNYKLWISYDPQYNAGINFFEERDFNDNGLENTKDWFKLTNNIWDDGIMEPYDEYKVIWTSYPYVINKTPIMRKWNNIEIVYTLAKWRNEWDTWFGPTYHTEYQPYEITWCGDGIKDNYTENFGNKDTINEVCDPNDSLKLWWGNGGCTSWIVKGCQAITITPSITIDKQAANPADRDGDLTDDTQLISYNTDVVFNITVRNDGDENLKEVRIEDPKASDCSLSVAQALPYIQAIWNWDDIFDINESFDYTCSKSNVVLDDVNLATVYWIGIITSETVSDLDNSPYIIDPSTIPALISIDKVDLNTADLDGWLVDTQTIMSGSVAVFQITVTNTGNDDLINVKILDGEAPACDLELDELLIWESHTYTCIDNDVPETYTNLIGVTADGKLSWEDDVSDFNTSDVVLSTTGIIPICTNLTSTPLTWVVPFSSNFTCTWDNTSIFDIKVSDLSWTELYSSRTSTGAFEFTNTGSYRAECFVDNQTTTTSVCSNTITATPVIPIVPAISIVKVDNNLAEIGGVLWDDTQAILAGSSAVFNITVTNSGNEDLNTVTVTDAESSTCDRNFDLDSEWNGNGIFDIGESFTYNCTDANVLAGYTNTADTSGFWVTSWLEVTASDDSFVVIDVSTVPVCTWLTANPDSGSSTLLSSFECTWNNTSIYKIEVKNPGGDIINTINSSTGSFNFVGNGTYSVSCFVENQATTVPACVRNVVLSSWGGWSSPRCNNINLSGNTFTCNGNSQVESYRLDCWNGSNLFLPSDNWGWNFANFDVRNCGYTASSASNANLKCYTSGASNIIDANYSGWNTRLSCNYSNPGWGWGWGWSCGDGAVQLINSYGNSEQCDGTVWCSSSCQLDRTTFPRNADIEISWLGDNYIIWNTMNLYVAHSGSLSKPTIKNNSTNENSDYFIDELCVHRKLGNSLRWDTQCSDVGWLYPNAEAISFDEDITFIWNTNSIIWGKETNTVEYTLRHEGHLYNSTPKAFFAKQFEVTVLKPTITTTGWGTSYVNTVWGLSDLEEDTKLLGWIKNKVNGQNKNFVWASIGWLSSYSKWWVDSTEADKEANNLNDSFSGSFEDTNSEFENYNGIDNVYYLKWNKTLDSRFNPDINLDWENDNWVSKTYIVEGNLTITENITYAGNIAFVVKNWNLIIWNNVTSLKGTYIVIWWSILGTSWNTERKLNIKGSVHWKMNNLLSKRIYIKNNSNGLIDVGTIVSFGSSVFRKPAPLTTKFIGEYIESQKVAQ
jgi:hypothetical protein